VFLRDPGCSPLALPFSFPPRANQDSSGAFAGFQKLLVQVKQKYNVGGPPPAAGQSSPGFAASPGGFAGAAPAASFGVSGFGAAPAASGGSELEQSSPAAAIGAPSAAVAAAVALPAVVNNGAPVRAPVPAGAVGFGSPMALPAEDVAARGFGAPAALAASPAAAAPTASGVDPTAIMAEIQSIVQQHNPAMLPNMDAFFQKCVARAAPPPPPLVLALHSLLCTRTPVSFYKARVYAASLRSSRLPVRA
jgi:hypothetical protein